MTGGEGRRRNEGGEEEGGRGEGQKGNEGREGVRGKGECGVR